MTKHFSFAIRIQPLTGQLIEEWPTGVDLIGLRHWTDADRAKYPQAERQVAAMEDMCLAVDRERRVFIVPEDELLEMARRNG